MATITSTIKLVDQMTPTLNKISKAIDNVKKKSDSVVKAEKSAQSQILADRRLKAQMIKRLDLAEIAEAREKARAKKQADANYINWWKARLAEQDAAEQQSAKLAKQITQEEARSKKLADANYVAWWKEQLAQKDAATRASAQAERQAKKEAIAAAKEKARIEREIAQQNSRYGNAMLKYTGLVNYKQAQFNSTLSKTRTISNGVLSAFRRILSTLGMIVGIRAMIETADTMMNSTARINNLTGDLAKTQYYLDAIYASAQRSRGSFTNMVNSVGKLGTIAGDAFGSVEEMIAFTELMNKLFVLSGASAAESSNAMYQLTQAMAAGKLQGDEMRSILENAPMLAQKIAKSLGVTTGELKELGADGKITADIIKEALFDAADDIEKRFENMPKTIGQTWNEIKNYALNAFRPVITAVQNFINSPIFEEFKNRLFNIITVIANAVIRLFNAFQTPVVQEAISKICTALSTLWDVAVWVGTTLVNIAIWISENWSWIAPIIYTLIWAFLIYKAAIVVATVAIWAYNAAMFVAGLIAGTIVLTTFGWIVLIIVAIIAVIYLAVAAWNHWTGQSVSATGIILGGLLAIVACLWDVIVFIWDCIGTVWEIVVWLVKTIIRVVGDLFDILINAIVNFFLWICNVFLGIAMALNAAKEKMVGYWQLFVANGKLLLLNLALMATQAFNDMIQSAGNGATKILTPFVNLYNKLVDIFNEIVRAWNNSVAQISIEIPEWVPKWGGKTFGVNSWNEVGKIDVNDIIDFSADIESTLLGKIADAEADKAAAQQKIADNDISDAFLAGYTTIEYLSWFEGVDFDGYKSEWNSLLDGLDKVWDSGDYWNPADAYNTGYAAGEAVDNGISGLVEGIGGLLGSLFGGSGTTGGSLGELNRGQGTGADIPSSLEDLLSGYGGDGIGNNLGAIADNTGKSAGSASNIEDTLDLAEEELELLRKLAEQEVINRFTTAEIHVDMTNNNNVSSNMDLDGIVTHLSNKLYEELGVVASGVHY